MSDCSELAKIAASFAVALAKQYDAMEPGPARSVVGEATQHMLNAKSALYLAHHLESGIGVVA